MSVNSPRPYWNCTSNEFAIVPTPNGCALSHVNPPTQNDSPVNVGEALVSDAKASPSSKDVPFPFAHHCGG